MTVASRQHHASLTVYMFVHDYMPHERSEQARAVKCDQVSKLNTFSGIQGINTSRSRESHGL